MVLPCPTVTQGSTTFRSKVLAESFVPPTNQLGPTQAANMYSKLSWIHPKEFWEMGICQRLRILCLAASHRTAVAKIPCEEGNNVKPASACSADTPSVSLAPQPFLFFSPVSVSHLLFNQPFFLLWMPISKGACISDTWPAALL